MPIESGTARYGAPTARANVSPTTARHWSRPDLSVASDILDCKSIRRIIVVCGTTSATTLGVRDIARRALRRFNCDFVEGVASGSPIADVLRCRTVIRTLQPDAVIAIGGGSVIDVAKAGLALASRDDALSTSDVAALWAQYPVPLPERRIRLIAVPTTAGTGSEATPYAALTDDRNRRLFGVSALLQPDHAILVPEFVQTVPQPVVADVGLDAFSHAIEALWSRRATEESDTHAYNALWLTHQHLRRYYRTPSDPMASRGMQMAATLAGEAFRLASATACHALSFPLSDESTQSHGFSCGWLLAPCATMNLEDGDTRRKMSALAALLDLGSADAIPMYITELRAALGFAVSQAPAVNRSTAERIHASAVRHMLDNNPVTFDQSRAAGLLAHLGV